MFLLGNHERIAEEIPCDPPTVGKGKGILGAATRDAHMAEGEAWFPVESRNSLPGLQGALKSMTGKCGKVG